VDILTPEDEVTTLPRNTGIWLPIDSCPSRMKYRSTPLWKPQNLQALCWQA